MLLIDAVTAQIEEKNIVYNLLLSVCLQKITEQKLQAFQIGTMGQRPLSRREQEERRKKEEEIAAASVFKEFVETFEGGGTSSKVWVKAGTYDAGSRSEYYWWHRSGAVSCLRIDGWRLFVAFYCTEEDSREKGKLYKPTSKLEEKLSSTEKALDYCKALHKPEPTNKKNKIAEKKKSMLEMFKEELEQ